MTEDNEVNYAEQLIKRHLSGEFSLSELSDDDFFNVLKYTSYDGLDERTIGAARGILNEGFKRSRDNKEMFAIMSDSLYGVDKSRQLSDEYNLLSTDEKFEISDHFFVTNLGLKQIDEEGSKIINTDYIIAAMSDKDFDVNDHRFENTVAAINVINSLDVESEVLKNLSNNDIETIRSFSSVFDMLDDDKDQEIKESIKRIEGEYRKLLEASPSSLTFENTSAMERMKNDLAELMPQDGSISEGPPQDDPREINLRNKQRIEIEEIDWEKRYNEFLNQNAQKIKIMSFGDKRLAKLRGDNGFSPKYASLFGDSIVATDKYGDALNTLWNVRPFTGTLCLGRNFDYSNPEQNAITFGLSALHARRKGWSNPYIEPPTGSDAQAKLFLEQTIQAMIEVGEYSPDDLRVPRKYQHVLDSFKVNHGLIKEYDQELDGLENTGEELSQPTYDKIENTGDEDLTPTPEQELEEVKEEIEPTLEQLQKPELDEAAEFDELAPSPEVKPSHQSPELDLPDDPRGPAFSRLAAEFHKQLEQRQIKETLDDGSPPVMSFYAGSETELTLIPDSNSGWVLRSQPISNLRPAETLKETLSHKDISIEAARVIYDTDKDLDDLGNAIYEAAIDTEKFNNLKKTIISNFQESIKSGANGISISTEQRNFEVSRNIDENGKEKWNYKATNIDGAIDEFEMDTLNPEDSVSKLIHSVFLKTARESNYDMDVAYNAISNLNDEVKRQIKPIAQEMTFDDSPPSYITDPPPSYDYGVEIDEIPAFQYNQESATPTVKVEPQDLGTYELGVIAAAQEANAPDNQRKVRGRSGPGGKGGF